MADSQRKTANLFDATIEQGTITINGDVAADNRIRTKEYIDIDSEYITLSWNSEQNTEAFIMMYDANGDYVRGEGWVTSPATKQLLSAIKKIRIIWRYELQADISPSAITNTMLNTGSTTLPYEPYWQHSLRKLGTSTDTLTTLPSDLYADGTNATVGLVGNMEQTGTPSPTTPIQPQECGERTGNILPPPVSERSGTTSDITYKVNANGLIELSGTASATTSIEVVLKEPFVIPQSVSSGGGGTIAINNSMTAGLSLILYNGSTVVDSWGFTTINRTATSYSSMAGKTITRYLINIPSGASVTNGTIGVAFSNDSVPVSPFIPYGYKIPILSANTTTPVYLGEVQSTRQIKKLVLTGNEANWGTEANMFTLAIDMPMTSYADYICSHYNAVFSYDNCNQNNNTMAISKRPVLFIHDNTYSTIADFKTYLQQQYANGTPVTVWYVLAEPETGIVNEPLRKIGNYADTVSGISIPTISGKDTFDVQTTLKPSEVSLAYTGWHDATVKGWDGSEWQ